MKKDILKNGYSFILLFLVLVSSCTKSKDSGDVVMDQAFSLPLGERIMNIEQPTGMGLPGLLGTFYYNGRPYPINTLYFQKEEQIDFKLENPDKIEWIKRVDFILKLENGFPVNSYLQIYLLNPNRQIIDSIFVEGKQKAGAGEVNSLDEVDKTLVSIFESSFEGERLDRLKATNVLSYKMYLETRRDDGAILRFTSISNIKVNMAMRLFLKYKLNDI